MKFEIDLDKLNPGIWFWRDDESRKEGICLRYLPSTKLREFLKATTEPTDHFILNDATKRMEVVTTAKRDTAAYDNLVYDWTIVDWKLKDKNERDIPCTTENKLKLIYEYPPFFEWYMECIVSLSKLYTEKKEAQKKTSEKSQED